MEQVSPLQFSRYRELKKKFYPSKPNVPSRPQPEKVAAPPIKRDWLIIPPPEDELEKVRLDKVWNEIYGGDDIIRKTMPIMKGFSGRRSARIMIAKVLVKHQFTFIDIAGHAKSRRWSDCRFEIYYRLRRELGMSLMQIGRMLNKDHTSVLHGYRMMEKRIANGYVLEPFE